MYRENFCLTKGDKAITGQKMIESPPALHLSSSVHRVLEEQHATNESKLLSESDIHDKRLCPILQGHKVHGAALCPSVSSALRKVLEGTNQNSRCMLIWLLQLFGTCSSLKG